MMRRIAYFSWVPLLVACSETKGPDADGPFEGAGGAPAALGGSSPGTGGLEPGIGGSSPAASGGDGVGGAFLPSGGTGVGGEAAGSGGASDGSGESAGCGSPSPLESGTFTLDVEGTERNYMLEVPANYDTRHPYRLVFVWHPLGGSARQVAQGGYNGLRSRANGSAIFVAPDGLTGMAAGINGQGWYNAEGGDMKFLGRMLEHFKTNLCVDEARIFSTGFSFGGMMSYAVGFEYGDVFRALAPSSGNLQATRHERRTTNPIAILALHGASDEFVATSGGRSAVQAYVERNGCAATTQPVEPTPCVAYQECDAPTIWCEYPGEHAPWSGAPAAIWDFFSQF